MTCREFETAWNDRLDARETSPLTGGPSEAHVAACSSCRALNARFQVLQQALRQLPELRPSSDFALRVVAGVEAEPGAIAGRIAVFRRWRGFAAAAAGVVAVGWGFWHWTVRDGAEVRPPVAVTIPAASASAPDDLAAALASATSATLDLAREASAPAARVGRDVLIAADLPAAPAAPDLPDGVSRISGVWQSVGERVNYGVRPLGGSARHAFGFLLGTGADEPAPPAPAPKRGA